MPVFAIVMQGMALIGLLLFSLVPSAVTWVPC